MKRHTGSSSSSSLLTTLVHNITRITFVVVLPIQVFILPSYCVYGQQGSVLCNVCGGDPNASMTKPTVEVSLSALGFGDAVTALCSELFDAGAGSFLLDEECELIKVDPTIQGECGCSNYIATVTTAPVPVAVPITAVPVVAAPITAVPVAVPITVAPVPITAVPVAVVVPVTTAPVIVTVAPVMTMAPIVPPPPTVVLVPVPLVTIPPSRRGNVPIASQRIPPTPPTTDF